jgi:hypothetical protein
LPEIVAVVLELLASAMPATPPLLLACAGVGAVMLKLNEFEPVNEPAVMIVTPPPLVVAFCVKLIAPLNR